MRSTVNHFKQPGFEVMYRPSKAQVRQSAKAAPEAPSASHKIGYWRTQAAAASERERKALAQAAELQRENELLREKIKEIQTLLQLSIDITLK